MNSSPAAAAQITVTYDATLHRRTVSFSGPIHDRDLLEAFEALLSPDYDASADDLIDLSAVTHMGVSSAGLHRLLAMYEERDETGHHTRNAIIAPTDVLYGVSRMFQALHGDGKPDELEVFRNRDDALRWIAQRPD